MLNIRPFWAVIVIIIISSFGDILFVLPDSAVEAHLLNPDINKF